MERYITDSLDTYPVGPCPSCGGTIARADLTRKEDWTAYVDAETEIPLLWIADGPLVCAICENSRQVTADVQTGSVKPVFTSMRKVA
jgi:hypothetical protein